MLSELTSGKKRRGKGHWRRVVRELKRWWASGGHHSPSKGDCVGASGSDWVGIDL